MIVEATTIAIGVAAAVSIAAPTIICSAVWVWYCNRRLLRAEQDAREWREAATHAIIRSNIRSQSQPLTDIDDDEDDTEFPRH